MTPFLNLRNRFLLWFLLGTTVLMAFFPITGATGPGGNSPGFKIINLSNRIKKVIDSEGRILLLVPRGEKVPPIKAAAVIFTPVRRVVYASITQVCLLRPLNDPAVWQSVAGVTTPLDQWFIPEIKEGLKRGSIRYVGDGYHPDYELIHSLRPEVVFIYTGPSGQFKLQNMLQRLNIPYAVDNEYLENDPLTRLNWLKFIAAFYHKEAEVEDYLQQVRTRIERLRGQLVGIQPAGVAWGMIFNGKVYVPGAASLTSRMIEMAGGINVFKESARGTASVPLGIEEFYAQARNADCLILSVFPAAAPSLAALVRDNPVLSLLSSVRNERVWCLQPWYFQLVDRPDQILRDLIMVIHPSRSRYQKVEHFWKLPPK